MTKVRTRRIRLALVFVGIGALAIAAAIYRPKGPTPGSDAHDLQQAIKNLDQSPGIVLDPAATGLPREESANVVAEALFNAPDKRQWRSELSRSRAAADNVTNDQRQQLARLFADWITLRAHADADAYVQWMLSRGCKLRTDDPAIDQRAEGYEAATGAPFTSSIPSEELFTAAFDASLQWKDGILRPVDLAAIEMRFGQVKSPKSIIETELTPDHLDILWWGGATTNAGRRYFDPPRTYEQLIQRKDRLLAGAVFAAVLGENGGWVTIRFYAYWDPFANKWWINNITATNLTQSLIGTGIVY